MSLDDMKIWNDLFLEAEKPNKEKTMELNLEAKPLSFMRKAIAKVMKKTQDSAVSFTGMRYLDVSKIDDLRKTGKEILAEKNVRLTFLAFITKAVAKALVEIPQINVRSSLETKEIIMVKNINIGIAIDGPKGLVVPVIKNADSLNIVQIAKKIQEFVVKTTNGQLSLEDLKDGSFTITNYGSLGLTYATPIMNYPESAILGVGALEMVPIFDGQNLTNQKKMPFSMTADHCLIDGGDVARFLARLQNFFNNPEQLLK